MGTGLKKMDSSHLSCPVGNLADKQKNKL